MTEPAEDKLLPLQGIVLAGGRSSRMGRDKALVELEGRPMVEIAVRKLRSFCQEVAISGNRTDLAAYAPVIPEERIDAGPAAGIAAGLAASSMQWALFLPVDVPLLPACLLRRWAQAVLERESTNVRCSYLQAAGARQPAICMVHQDCLAPIRAALSEGMYKVGRIFEMTAAGLEQDALWIAEAEAFAQGASRGAAEMQRWFSNVNTPGDLAAIQ